MKTFLFLPEQAYNHRKKHLSAWNFRGGMISDNGIEGSITVGNATVVIEQ